MSLPNRETIQMLWKVKKLVREEFNVTIQISQKDLEPVLIDFAQQTTNATLKALIAQVVAPATITQTNKVKNLYRDETNVEVLITQETPEASPLKNKNVKKKQIIYRGQVISQEDPSI
ncbi:hypothetical protein A9Q81_21745 [Gammaproteobacteria bacterium 42_54_T18]|nr:hypothetical protein A9Q81_21745 [Gammaproteobacteria bacterium 42_54_T18]